MRVRGRVKGGAEAVGWERCGGEGVRVVSV